MENTDIDGKIVVKQTELNVEKDSNKRAILQKDLQILNLRKQIISFQERIQQIRNGM